MGIRLKLWNTNPTWSRRTWVSSLSFNVVRSVPPMDTEPEVRESSPATQCISVDFPEPDGPMMAVKRPASKSTLTSSSARTSVSSEPYTLTALVARAAAVGLDGVRGEVMVMRTKVIRPSHRAYRG